MGARHDISDTEEILKRAIAIDAVSSYNKETLLKTAAELGISPQSVELAEREHFQRKREMAEREDFIRHQRHGFWGHLGTYLIVNAFLVCMDLFSNHRLEWSYWSILGWGIGVALHAWEVFDTKGEDFQKEFDKWREERRKTADSDSAT
jgi:hypothetical protein